MRGSNDESLYFFNDGSFSNQGALSYKTKPAPGYIITDELAIEVADNLQPEESIGTPLTDTLVLTPYLGSSSFNVDDYNFFKMLLNDQTGRSSIEDLCKKIATSLKLDEADVITATNDINL